MKFLAILASVAAAAVGVQAQTADDKVVFAQEPGAYGPDSDVFFVDQPGYSDANATSSLTFANVDPSTNSEPNRELQVVEGVIVGFQIAAAVAPIIAEIIKGQRKECQQVACWVSSNSRPCSLSVAERVQAEMMKGRDRYRYESIQSNGMWVRYWRTKFEPVDRGVIASGTCSNGVKFSVTNCQSTGQVHC